MSSIVKGLVNDFLEITDWERVLAFVGHFIVELEECRHSQFILKVNDG
jgi:hypothetical protein